VKDYTSGEWRMCHKVRWIDLENGRICTESGMQPEEFVLMQYTGLMDDTGREIYEGDIVRLHDSVETKTPYVSQVYLTYDGALVTAHPAHIKMGAGPRLRELSWYCSYGICEETTTSCRVIGNIYENPELLR
jgi:uncharacterized phage protein (TIGR01671 family)